MDNSLKVRITTSIFFVIAVFALLFSGNIGQLILISIISVGSTYELLKMSKLNFAATLSISIVLITLYILAYLYPPNETIILTFTSILCLGYAFIAYSLLKAKSFQFKLIPFISIFYPGVCGLMYAATILDAETKLVAGLLTGTILLIWLNDAFAYLIGRKIGKTPLNAIVSPNKTMEGFYAGGIATILGGLLMTFIIPILPIFTWLSIAIVVWITGVTGDLIQSAFKRKFGVKDSGTIMPGHGGFYDRFDSLIFTLPFVYLLFKIIN